MRRRPKMLEQKWIRAKEISNQYPIGLSTVWDWAKKGKLTPIKVSTRVTVFDLQEVQNLFSQNMSSKIDDTKKTQKRKFRKNYKRKPTKPSYKNHIDRELDREQQNKAIDRDNYNRMQRNANKLTQAKEGIIGQGRKK